MEEEMELEEGEAYSYHNNDQYGDCMDPDELNYIDVKLQHVLGHFQKDFEGGLSAENLGAKFGGYGSFLPTYQRSPQSKTSPNIQKKDAQPSPSPSPVEEGQRSSVVTVAAPQIQKHGPTSTITSTPGTGSNQNMKSSKGKEKSMPPLRTVEDENSYESANKKFCNTSDRKTLKVRIKLGSSDNLSTKNKAALYSGLGLDSPSSSLEQSPFKSEGRSCDPQPMGFDFSPTSILQVMTSSPLNGALLLSPLADDLIFFCQKSLMEQKTTPAPRNIFGDKKQKSVEKVSNESGGSRSRKPQGDVGGTSGKELDADSLAYDDLISNTMKLPIISNTSGDMAKGSKKPSNYKEEKVYELEADLFDPQPKGKNADSKSSSLGQDGPSRALVKEHRSSSGKRKSKGSQNSGTADNSKDSLNVSSSKSKKRPSEDSLRAKSENGDLKLQKVVGKGRDLYSDFFGDLEQEWGNPSEAAEKETKDTPKNHGIVEKAAPTLSNGSKVRFRNKMAEKDPVSANNGTRDLGFASGDKHSDVAPVPVAPVLIKENWVQCDKCQQWRLLPIGRNPKSLPASWLCSMLDWLPGMNRCSITEQETNEAVMALHQAPVPDVNDNMHLSIKNDGSNEFSVPLKNNMLVDRKRSVGGGNHMPLKGEADVQLPSKFQDVGSDGQSHKQRGSTYYADEGDAKIVKGSKKVKNGEIPDEDRKSIHRINVKKVGHSSSRGLPAATEGKSRSFDELGHVSNHDYVDNNLTEQPRDKVQVSFDSDGRGTSDSGKSASRKRKAKEPQGFQGSLDCSPWHQNQSNEVLSRDDEHKKQKKSREAKVEGRESTASEGNGRSDKRGKKKQNMQHDPGSSQSQRELDETKSKRKGTKVSVSALAATSSSSKLRKCDQSKTSLQEMKVSPGESVSSSPMRSSKHDKLLSGRGKGGAGKDDSLDAASLPLSSPRRSSDGGNMSKIHVENENGARPYRKSLEASDRDNYPWSTDKEKGVPSIDISRSRPVKIGGDGSDRVITQHPTKLQDSDQRHDGQNGDNLRVGGSHSRKSGKGSNSEKRRSLKHDRAADNKKVSDPSRELKDSDEKRWETEHKYVVSSGDGKKGSRKIEGQDAVLNQTLDEEKSSVRGGSGRADNQSGNGSGRGKGQILPPSGAGQDGVKPRNTTDANKAVNAAIEGDDPAAKMMSAQMERAGHQNGKRQQNDKHLTSNGTTQEVDTTTSVRRESFFQLATNALKEAKDLKHMADRVEIPERTGLYFEAALKFLHGASLRESSYNATLKNSEFVNSTQTYGDTAKLCEYCGHDYEKSKDMASAALAYKCTEVAYLKVVYLSQSNASRDRHDLQTVLKMIPPEESPSSASEVDHVNNSSLSMDKANVAKGVSSPQVAGNQIITARNRPSFERLLNYAQNVNNAMEASRKSRAAFDSAIAKAKDPHLKEAISFIRRALDYNFQDVEGLLQLVRQATEVISQ